MNQLIMENKTDELSQALLQMQENLKRVSEEHAERIWLQTGRNTLNERLRGDKTLHEIVKDIIDFLAFYFTAQIGTLYVFEEGALHLQYAYGVNGQAKASFQPGEGLIGQAASEKKLKVITKIPQGYFSIVSSAGELKPDAVAILPAIFDNKVVSVIELGKFGDFSPAHIKFLEEISESLAISINSVLSKKDLEKLIVQLHEKEEEINNHIAAINKSNAEVELDLDGRILDRNSVV